MYENEAISTDKYEEMYDSESMTLDYCGQMCQGLHETNFMGKEVYNRAYEVSGRDKVTRSLENLKKKIF